MIYLSPGLILFKDNRDFIDVKENLDENLFNALLIVTPKIEVSKGKPLYYAPFFHNDEALLFLLIVSVMIKEKYSFILALPYEWSIIINEIMRS